MKIKAKKVNMTQLFQESGVAEPVTLLVLEKDSSTTLSPNDLGESLGEGGGEVNLKEGDIVTVSGTSKGKGFQGVVKRHGFKGGPRSHGQKHSEREPGSIGGGGRAGGKVAKGMRMAGRMGGKRVTVKNLEIVRVFPETNEVYIRGAIPGRRGSLVEIRANGFKK